MGLDKAKEGKRERRGERGSGPAPSSWGGCREEGSWRGGVGGTSLSPLLGNPGVKITPPK